MSTLRVEVTPIDRIDPHPNADRLEIAVFKGWQSVVPKGQFLAGQAVVYIPVDSILPPELECYIFPPDAKIKLEKSRVRTIKIRKALSEGLVQSLHDLRSGGFIKASVKVGDDLAEELGITKYEPPEKGTPQSAGKQVSKKKKNPDFHEYTSIENFKWYPELFSPGEEVVIMEKIHGTNFRAGWVPFFASTWWKKIKKFLHLAPLSEFVYGSHKVQLQDKLVYTGFYDRNVYAEAVVKYDLPSKLKCGEVIYGEIYGDSIQKGYDYGCPEERKLVVFDLKVNGQYVDHGVLVDFCRERGLPLAPVEYVGPYQSREHVKDNFVDGPSTLCPEQKIREGVVIKPLVEQKCYMGRKILKYKSDNFLMTTEDDTH